MIGFPCQVKVDDLVLCSEAVLALLLLLEVRFQSLNIAHREDLCGLCIYLFVLERVNKVFGQDDPALSPFFQVAGLLVHEPLLYLVLLDVLGDDLRAQLHVNNILWDNITCIML